MFNTKVLTRTIAFAGVLPLLAASSAFAQYRSYPGTYRAAGHYANRTVEGTVAAVAPARNGGEHVRLTNGMDLIVPPSISGMYENRRYQAAMLLPGDVVRMRVYSREGDGRDAEVRSLEILSRYNNGYASRERLISGTVVSIDWRNNIVVVETARGRRVDVDVNSFGRRNPFRRGDYVNISGRMDRGIFVADGARFR
jgi:hypothetical protein